MRFKTKALKFGLKTYRHLFGSGVKSTEYLSKLNTPDAEANRLEELYSYNILESTPEQIFDDLAILASEICQTPIAQISLLDRNRVWYKSNVGVDTEELYNEDTFCAFTVNTQDILIVPDTSVDSRFKENPIVKLFPKIRFYAGAPLISPNGYNLGALCVLDKEPRSLTATQQKALLVLAKQTVALLELRKLNSIMQQNNAELRAQVNKREQAEAAILHVSLHDPLTQLPNRRFLEQKLELHFNSPSQKEFALLFIDLDKFKSINDTKGHAAGDEVLKIVSQRLSQTIRKNDHISRIGGDEFVVLIDHHDNNHIQTVAQKLISKVNEPINLPQGLFQLSASIGIAHYPRDGRNFDTLINASDQALYKAKNLGRNRFELYN